MKKTYSFYLSVLISLAVLSGCTSPSAMGYKNGTVYLQAGQEQFQINGKLSAQKKENFSTLFIFQKVLQQKEGNFIIYENTWTDPNYEYEPSIHRSLQVIFEARRMVRIFGHGHLYAYQLELKNGMILNVMGQQGDTQSLKFIYGMSTAQLNRMLQKLDSPYSAPYTRNILTFKSPNHAIISKWDVQKVNFYPLIVPLARNMMPW